MRDFNHTVNVLVQAYLNNTLLHLDCEACAVGNIIRASGYRFKDAEHSTNWLSLIHKECRMGTLPINNQLDAEEQVRVTGYSVAELHLIEKAFESSCFAIEDSMFNGLMAVVDVLADIHGVDLTVKENAKALFVKAV